MQQLKDQTSTQSNNLKLANLWKLFNLVINKQKLSLIFMMNSYTGGVRGHNYTKYDLLRAPRKNIFVFILTSDY